MVCIKNIGPTQFPHTKEAKNAYGLALVANFVIADMSSEIEHKKKRTIVLLQSRLK